LDTKDDVQFSDYGEIQLMFRLNW